MNSAPFNILELPEKLVHDILMFIDSIDDFKKFKVSCKTTLNQFGSTAVIIEWLKKHVTFDMFHDPRFTKLFMALDEESADEIARAAIEKLPNGLITVFETLNNINIEEEVSTVMPPMLRAMTNTAITRIASEPFKEWIQANAVTDPWKFPWVMGLDAGTRIELFARAVEVGRKFPAGVLKRADMDILNLFRDVDGEGGDFEVKFFKSKVNLVCANGRIVTVKVCRYVLMLQALPVAPIETLEFFSQDDEFYLYTSDHVIFKALGMRFAANGKGFANMTAEAFEYFHINDPDSFPDEIMGRLGYKSKEALAKAHELGYKPSPSAIRTAYVIGSPLYDVFMEEHKHKLSAEAMAEIHTTSKVFTVPAACEGFFELL